MMDKTKIYAAISGLSLMAIIQLLLGVFNLYNFIIESIIAVSLWTIVNLIRGKRY